MLKWFKKRIVEPTTFIGMGLIVQAVMLFSKADPAHTELVSEIINQSSEPLANGDFTAVLTIGLSGLMGILVGEKGRQYNIDNYYLNSKFPGLLDPGGDL